MISYLPTCCLWCESTKNILKDWQICQKCHGNIFVYSYVNNVPRPRFYVDSFCSNFQFSGSLRDMIIKWKYNPSPEFTRPLGMAALTSWGLESINFDYIIPVSPHVDRLLERKIHQTLLLAKWISSWFGKPIFYGVHRTKETPSQTGLTKIERQENLSDSFRLDNPNFIKNRSLLLIDDVVTTGATLKDFIKLVKQSKPGAIHVRAIAMH